jgi:hypothetical protein
MAKLHDMFPAAMGWTNSHLHSFTLGDQLYGMQFRLSRGGARREGVHRLRGPAGGVRRFVYDYDFGDSWEHEVVV